MLNPDGDGTYVARMKLQDLIPQFLPIFGRITCQDDNGTMTAWSSTNHLVGVPAG